MTKRKSALRNTISVDEIGRAKAPNALPRHRLDAIDKFGALDFNKRTLGERFNTAFTKIKQSEYEQMSLRFSAAEWEYYGFSI